jgi:hypothetical protein
MVNKRTWLGILVMVLVFGMTVVGCNNDPDNGDSGSNGNNNGNSNGNGNGGTDSALNGTWILIESLGMPIEHQMSELKNYNGTFENSENGSPSVKGTYTTSGNKQTSTATHIYGTSNFIEPKLESRWYSQNELDTKYHSYFNTFITLFFINGNTLTFKNESGQTETVWIRK